MREKELVNLYRVFHVIGDEQVLRILFELERYGDKTFSELRDRLSINPASLSKKLKLLTQMEFIVPDKSHDRLRVYYSLHEHKRQVRRVLDVLERLSNDL